VERNIVVKRIPQELPASPLLSSINTDARPYIFFVISASALMRKFCTVWVFGFMYLTSSAESAKRRLALIQAQRFWIERSLQDGTCESARVEYQPH
jgi:hypothetical protein